nr:hypothetical protein [Tanacetum cinerariifolium]
MTMGYSFVIAKICICSPRKQRQDFVIDKIVLPLLRHDHGEYTVVFRLKKDQEKDKIRTKRDKNGKRGEAGKRSRGILKREWAVRPAGSNREAIPDQATTNTIFPSESLVPHMQPDRSPTTGWTYVNLPIDDFVLTRHRHQYFPSAYHANSDGKSKYVRAEPGAFPTINLVKRWQETMVEKMDRSHFTTRLVEVKKDKMALAAIYQGIHEDLLLSISEKKSAKEPWEALKTMFMRADKVKTARIQTLKAEFESLNMKEMEGVDEFAVKVSNIVSTMRALGDTVEESYVVKKLLREVPSKFLQIASTLKQFGDLGMMRVEEVIGRLKAHEERMKGYSESDDRKLLLTHQECRGRERDSNHGGRGRGRSGSYHQREGSQGECKNPRRERNHENNLIREHHDAEPAFLLLTFKSNGDGGRVPLNEENVTLQLRTHGAAPNQSCVWYLDTGASNHMTGDKYKFKNLNEMVQGYVKFGNEIKIIIEGKGSIVFQCKNGEQQKLDEVYCILDLCSNIISLGQLAVGGDEIKIKDPFLWVHDGTGKLLMKVHMSSNRLYKIELDEVRSTCLIAQISNITWIWHTRMGHVNFNSLKFMSEKNLIKGMPKMYTQTLPCEGCLVGKQTRKMYPSHTSFSANKRLELVHRDLCQPISPPTPTRNRYFMLLVDDYSRVMWVYLLKMKDEALEVFKNFRRKVEVETGEKLKLLRTDCGGDFLSNQFTTNCKETWLERHFTSPYSSQQNRVVERRNQTVVEMVRSMLKTMNVRNVLWGEPVNHAVYILNRVNCKAVKDSMPYEVWTRRKPHVEHLRVFGCVGDMKILKRDVIFEEDQIWEWEKSTKVKATQEPNLPQPDQIASQSDSDWTEGGSEPINSPTASSSTGGGAPKCYRLLTDPYQQTEEIEHPKELMMIQSDEEPVTYTEASKRGKWVKSMDSKLASIKKKNTWKLVDLLKNQNPIGLKWVYKVKRDPTEKIVKYKAIIVAKGYVQKHGIDYKEVFASVARIETVHLILALAGSYGWWVHHLDMKSAFLNGDFEEEVYVSQQEGYQKEGESNKVYKLSKALYVYTKKEKGDILIVGVYVDDLLNLLIKTQMLDCNPTKNPIEHKLKLLKEEGEPVNPTEYRSIVGGLRYLTHNRLDISFVVRIVSRFMEKPTVKHLQAMKRILRYVNRTLGYALKYSKGRKDITLTGYTNSDLANDVNDKKSTGGMAFYLNGNLVEKTAQRSKPIDIQFYFIRECVENGEITVAHVCGKEQKDDILTKPLARVKHEEMRNLMGIKKVLTFELRGKMLK